MLLTIIWPHKKISLKQENPAVSRKKGPVECFWSILKGKFYGNGRDEKKLCHLKPRIHSFFAQFEVVTIHVIVEGVKGRVDYIRRNDVIEKRE